MTINIHFLVKHWGLQNFKKYINWKVRFWTCSRLKVGLEKTILNYKKNWYILWKQAETKPQEKSEYNLTKPGENLSNKIPMELGWDEQVFAITTWEMFIFFFFWRGKKILMMTMDIVKGLMLCFSTRTMTWWMLFSFGMKMKRRD